MGFSPAWMGFYRDGLNFEMSFVLRKLLQIIYWAFEIIFAKSKGVSSSSSRLKPLAFFSKFYGITKLNIIKVNRFSETFSYSNFRKEMGFFFL